MWRRSAVSAEGFGVVPLDPSMYREELERMRKKAEGPGLKRPVESRFRQGDAAAEILAVAENLGCSLIVMGAHGRTGLARLLLGSVAESVMRRAPCPVLIVKTPVPSAPVAVEAMKPSSAMETAK
jgi:nucleotide-binding universal stress UspA family protein